MRLCTWNILSLYKPKALKLLIDQLSKYKADITALQEMRWIGNGVIEKKECTIYYSCGNKHMFGTGFIINQRVKHLVLDFKPVNERLSVLRIKGKFYNYSIINVHLPTEEKTEEEKTVIYNLLERAYDACPGSDIKIVIGDMNAQIGKEEMYYTTINKHSLHNTSNENGLKLIDFAISRGMIIGSTSFPHKDIHKGTWKSPDGHTINQIDHVLIERRHGSMLMDCRTFRGANIDSDHFLVVATIRAKISNCKKENINRRKQYNLEILKEPKKLTQYRTKLNEEINKTRQRGIDSITNIDDYWNIIKESLITTADDNIGKQERTKNKDWFDEDCQEATRKKNEAYQRTLQKNCTRQLTEDYRNKRKEEKKIHRRKKRHYENERMKEFTRK